MSGYDPYGQNAQKPPLLPPYMNHAAVLNALAPPRQDFPGLGTPVPDPTASTLPVPLPPGGAPTNAPPIQIPNTGPGAYTGPSNPYHLASTTPADGTFTAGNPNPIVNGVAPTPPLPRATPAQLATLTPEQRTLYDNALAHPGQVTDPFKFATTDFAKLGERPDLDKMEGGSTWEQLYGPPPAGYIYNANGGLMKRPFGDKINDVMTDVIIGGMTGGIGAASMGPTIASSVAKNFYTGQADPNMFRSAADRIASGQDASYVDGSNVGTQATSGVAAPGTPGAATTGTTGTTSTTPDTTGAGAANLPANVDTNGYAKPGYIAPKPASAPLAGYDSAKWNDPNHQSPKYVIGRIMSQYPQTTDGLKAAMAEIQKAYPGATQTGDDTISVPGVSTSVDVVKAGGGFWWNPETDENGKAYPKDTGGQGGPGLTSGDTSGGYDSSGDVAGSDVIKKIIARLGGMVGTGGGVTSARDAVLKQLGI